MDKDAAFMKAINDVITAIEGVQNTLGQTIERVIVLENELKELKDDKFKEQSFKPIIIDDGEEQENGEEEST